MATKRISKVTYQGQVITRKNLSIIRWWVGNQHCAESDLRLLRELYPKIKNQPRQLRRLAMQYAIEEHRENQDLYGYVMSGGHGYTGKGK